MKIIEFIDKKIEELISRYLSGEIKNEKELVERLREEEKLDEIPPQLPEETMC